MKSRWMVMSLLVTALVAVGGLKAAKEEAKTAKTESRSSDRGFLAKAKVLLVPGTKIEYAEIRSTVEGTFEGW